MISDFRNLLSCTDMSSNSSCLLQFQKKGIPTPWAALLRMSSHLPPFTHVRAQSLPTFPASHPIPGPVFGETKGTEGSTLKFKLRLDGRKSAWRLSGMGRSTTPPGHLQLKSWGHCVRTSHLHFFVSRDS